MNTAAALFTAGALACSAGLAAAADAPSDPIQLEQLTVYAPQPNGGSALGGTSVTQEDICQFNRDTLDSAVPLAAGTSVSAVGPRNETNVWIRGFDRWRVPLYWDGIPIYLPVDNRIDFGRFSTLDLASIEIGDAGRRAWTIWLAKHRPRRARPDGTGAITRHGAEHHGCSTR